MKVVRKVEVKEKVPFFEDLNAGDCFCLYSDLDTIYMACDDGVVNLRNGVYQQDYYFEDNPVKIVNCELIIRD